MNTVDAIRRIRESNGKTIHEMVEELGYSSDGSVGNVIKSGKTQMRSDNLVAFARVLGYKLILIPEDGTKEYIEIDS